MHDRNKLVIACAAAITSLATPIAAQESDEGATLEEVVVTARFREATVQDIGGSLVALSGEQLAEQGIQNVRDLANLIPSLSIQERGPGRNEISMRGIGRSVFQQDVTISPANIGLYLDDVPINVLQGSQLDVRSFDLARVEVLRGPQGTLFGEGAQGGALRYFTADPVIGEFSARFEADYTSVEDGDDDYGYRAMVNLPLGDSAALRLVGNHYIAPGYIDNAVDGTEDTNGYESDSFRAILLAEPTDRLRVRLLASTEQADQGAFSMANGDADDLTLYGVSSAGSFVDDEHEIYSANISYRFDSFRVESITSSFERVRQRRVVDAFYTNQVLAFRQLFALIDPVNLGFLGVPEGPVDPVYSIDESTYEQFSQEFRFISEFDGPFNFVAGLFYRDFDFEIVSQTESPSSPTLLPVYLGNIALDQATNPDSRFAGFTPTIPQNPSPRGNVLGDQLGLNAFFGSPSNNIASNSGEQISAFAEATWEFSPTWSATFGLRAHKEDIDLQTLGAGYDLLAGTVAPTAPVNFPPPAASGLGEVSVEVLLPKLAVEYTPSDRQLYYALYSEGVRNGNLNAGSTSTVIFQLFGEEVANELSTFEEETVRSFEAGVKLQSEDGRGSLNVAAYFNAFEDVQAFITFPGPPAFGLIDNVGDGETYGFEVEASYQLSERLRLFGGGGYTEATIEDLNLSSDELVAGIVEGQPIPFIPDYSFVAGLDLSLPLASSMEGYARATYTYTGEYTTFIDGDPGSRFNPELGDYGLVDLAVGLSADRWSLDFRVRNLFDEREYNQVSPTTAVVEGALGFSFLPSGVPADFSDDFQPIPPRSYVLTLGYNF